LDVTGEELWLEDGTVEDYVLDGPLQPELHVSQPAIETPSTYRSIQGEYLVIATAGFTELPVEENPIRVTNAVQPPRGSVATNLLMRTRVPATGARPVPLSMAPPLPKVPLSAIAHNAGLLLTRLSLSPARPRVRPANATPRTSTLPRTSNRPVHGPITLTTLVTASTPIARAPRPLELNVQGIVGMSKNHEYCGPQVGKKQHMDGYEEYKFDVTKTIGYYPGPDAAVVASLAAL
jgi:hypothetical protein